RKATLTVDIRAGEEPRRGREPRIRERRMAREAHVDSWHGLRDRAGWCDERHHSEDMKRASGDREHGRGLLGVMPDDGEHDQIHETERRQDREYRTALSAACASIEERHEDQEYRDETERHDTESLALDSQHVTRHELQR